jgi:hypothetical protein
VAKAVTLIKAAMTKALIVPIWFRTVSWIESLISVSRLFTR